MRMIQKFVDRIDDEVNDAKLYAERAIEEKVKGNTSDATKFKEMANDELKHATYLHDMAVRAIQEISKVYTAPVEMQEAWEKSHKSFVERVAWVKKMLEM